MRRWLSTFGMAFASLLLAACSGLPTQVDRPLSHALISPQDTPLGRLARAQNSAASARSASGFLLLSGPQDAYSSRLALVEKAQKTLDLQYYAIHADQSTARILQGVVQAAQRGVRVRILLDDFHSTGRNAQVMRLAYLPNIEMRMFNPLQGPRGSTLGRMLGAALDFSRVQQRMHNKLFIADNAMGITGGRNLGDAYFGTGQAGNFVDLDVLAAGPIVKDLSRSFDSYWNNERAYPVSSLVTPQELEAIQATLRPAPAPAPDVEPPAQISTSVDIVTASTADEPLASATWNQEAMDLSLAAFVWAPAAVLVDQPAKIPVDGGLAATELPQLPPARATPLAVTAGSANRAGALAPTGPARAATIANVQASEVQSTPNAATVRPTSLPDVPAPIPAPEAAVPGPSHAEARSEAQTDTVVDGLLQLMRRARRDLLIVSPYFVPGPDMKQAFAIARARGVRVRVLTNSLASNDAPIAHAGYARHRPDLLAMGVELFEMRSDIPAELRGTFGSSGRSGGARDAQRGMPTGGSRAMLHSKLLVMDGSLVVVGSMNLDMRSQLQNTEIALLIRSAELARQATGQIETALREAAWQVRIDHGRIAWRPPHGSAHDEVHSEPDASLPLRLMIDLLGPFAPDHLL